MKKTLVIDDDQAVLNYLKMLLLQAGEYTPYIISDSKTAYKEIKNGGFDLVILDMDMPDVTGLDILKYINENNIDIETIILTGVEDVELAVSAMKLGAYDYITKPVDNDLLLNLIRTALEKKRLMQGQPSSMDDLKNKDAFKHIITQNREMIKIFDIIEKISNTDSSILIWGESGTGKELIARSIHKISKRQNENFIAVNAGTFADELFGPEFFGHTKGAFTGAYTDKKGFLEEANKGSLFLDEIGELPLPTQVKLLRVLQEGEFFRIGSTKNVKVDVRIIAATNKNLLDEMKKGNFRKDLFYRLNMNSVYLPPLRERKDDILLLAYHFLKKFCKQNDKNISKISSSVEKLLTLYNYPGNVRELMNIINSSVIIETTCELKKSSLPQYFLNNADTLTESIDDEELIYKSLKDIEKEHIKRVMTHTHGNKSKASKILGISRVNLIAKIKSYDLEGLSTF